ncbi:MAG: hypothetical protein HY291_18315 [Planctomycetes bacterium]|nr:hypothetical protein [Planctomycetota bacterium]
MSAVELPESPSQSSPERSPQSEAAAIQQLARRAVLMSKGLGIALVGAGMMALGGVLFFCKASLGPAASYALPIGLACGLGMALLPFWAERHHAKNGFHVRSFRKSTVLDLLILFVGIPLGVLGVCLLADRFPALAENEWIGLIFLCAFLLLSGGYFFHLSVQLQLFEYLLPGAAFLAAGVLAVVVRLHPSLAESCDRLMPLLPPVLGVLMVIMGASLHRRWRIFRKQGLDAQPNGEPA